MANNFTKIANGVNLVPQATTTSPADGDVWYDSSVSKFKVRENGTTVDMRSSSGGGGLSWSVITSGTTASSGSGYVTNSGSQLAIAAPSTSAVGDTFAVIGLGSGGWSVTFTNSQRGIAAPSDTVMGGNISATDSTACAEFTCIVANSTWSVRSYRGTLSATAGSASFGYTLGGFTSIEQTTIERLQFSNETRTTISAVLSVAKYYNCGFTSTTKGYSIGGDNSTAGQLYNTIEALTFSGETTGTISATIGTATERAAGVYLPSQAGYMLGGNTNRASPTGTRDAQKLLYSNETTSTLTTFLTTGRFDNAGGSSSIKGYSFCGFTSGESNTIEGINFSNDTYATVSTTSSQSKHALACVQSSSAAYPAGGSGPTNRIEKFLFSGETISTLAATLDTAKRDMCPMSGGSKGYYCGGDTGSFTNVIEDMNFSNDTSAAISATLSANKAYMAGVQGG